MRCGCGGGWKGFFENREQEQMWLWRGMQGFSIVDK